MRTRKEHAQDYRHPGELILRPLLDSDIVLCERWFEAGHVKPWYEHPGDWLHELNNRRGEFSYITHLIAEIEGVPMGFCQYYDIFYGQEHEDWLDVSRPGVVFSIDYLIGEAEYLYKGFGQKMIALI